MRLEWASLVGAAGGALATMLATSSMRSILRAIFQHPRETSVIYKVDGKRAEVSLSQHDIETLRAAVVARAHALGLTEAQAEELARGMVEACTEPVPSGGTRAAAGGASDE